MVRSPVAIAEPQLRLLVGQLLDKAELRHVDAPNWRRAAGTVESHLSLAIVNLDGLGKNAPRLVALLGSGWREPVPFIALGQQADVEKIAADLGAIAAFRKPLDPDQLLSRLRQIVSTGDA